MLTSPEYQFTRGDDISCTSDDILNSTPSISAMWKPVNDYDIIMGWCIPVRGPMSPTLILLIVVFYDVSLNSSVLSSTQVLTRRTLAIVFQPPWHEL